MSQLISSYVLVLTFDTNYFTVPVLTIKVTATTVLRSVRLERSFPHAKMPRFGNMVIAKLHLIPVMKIFEGFASKDVSRGRKTRTIIVVHYPKPPCFGLNVSLGAGLVLEILIIKPLNYLFSVLPSIE